MQVELQFHWHCQDFRFSQTAHDDASPFKFSSIYGSQTVVHRHSQCPWLGGGQSKPPPSVDGAGKKRIFASQGDNGIPQLTCAVPAPFSVSRRSSLAAPAAAGAMHSALLCCAKAGSNRITVFAPNKCCTYE